MNFGQYFDQRGGKKSFDFMFSYDVYSKIDMCNVKENGEIFFSDSLKWSKIGFFRVFFFHILVFS